MIDHPPFFSKCANCDKEDPHIEFEDKLFCSFLCVGAYKLNEDPFMKEFHKKIGISK